MSICKYGGTSNVQMTTLQFPRPDTAPCSITASPNKHKRGRNHFFGDLSTNAFQFWIIGKKWGPLIINPICTLYPLGIDWVLLLKGSKREPFLKRRAGSSVFPQFSLVKTWIWLSAQSTPAWTWRDSRIFPVNLFFSHKRWHETYLNKGKVNVYYIKINTQPREHKHPTCKNDIKTIYDTWLELDRQ